MCTKVSLQDARVTIVVSEVMIRYKLCFPFNLVAHEDKDMSW